MLPMACTAEGLSAVHQQGYFCDWRDQSLFERINSELPLQPREAAGRARSPSAGISDVVGPGRTYRCRRAIAVCCRRAIAIVPGDPQYTLILPVFAGRTVGRNKSRSSVSLGFLFLKGH
jgi:hypothetical protein